MTHDSFSSCVINTGGHQQYQHADVAVPWNRRSGNFLQMGSTIGRIPQGNEPQARV